MQDTRFQKGSNTAKVWFLFVAGFVFYAAFMAMVEYWKNVAGLKQATIFINTTPGATLSAGAIAAAIVLRYRRRHRREISQISAIMPPRLILESGMHTSLIVGSSNAVYTNTGWAVAAGSGLLKGLALQFSAFVDHLLVRAKLKREPNPNKHQLDTWALRVAIIGIALIVWGKLDFSRASSIIGMLIVLLCAGVYAGAYARRQYLAGTYRVLVNRLIAELKLTPAEAEAFSAIAEKWWFGLEQMACLLCSGGICSSVAVLYAYVFDQGEYLYFHPGVFFSGVPFGIMSYFAVSIMLADYRLAGEEEPASMKARMVMTKGQGVVASLVGPIPTIWYFGLKGPSGWVIAGSLVVLLAVIIPFVPDFAGRIAARIRRARGNTTASASA